MRGTLLPYMLYIKIVTLFVCITSCNSLYEHVNADLYVIDFILSQVQASMFPIDPTRNLKQPAAQLSLKRALSADICGLCLTAAAFG